MSHLLADAIRSGDGDFMIEFCIPYDVAIPPPECVKRVGFHHWCDRHIFTLKSIDDVQNANEWLLRRAGIDSESHPLSLISVLIYFKIVETMFWTKGDIETVEEEETYKHLSIISNRFDMPIQHPVFVSMDLLCTDEMQLADVEEVAHLTNRYRKAVLIQNAFRKMMRRKHNAAYVIQRTWRRVIGDPSCGPCKTRLMWEFEQF